MAKVSVATRCPCMKTPNDPESTIWVDAGAGLSFFLSALVAVVDAAGRQSALKAKMIPSPSLLLLDVRPVTPAQDCMPPPPRLRLHSCRWFRCGQPLSCNAAAAFRTVPEIA